MKDNFIIFAISLFLFAISENKINYKNLIIAILICFLFRPLPGYFILLSTLSYLLLDSYFYKKGNFRLFFLLTIIIFSVSTYFVFNQYSIALSTNFISDILDRINLASGHYSDPQYSNLALTYGGEEQNFVTRIFYYYFMPITINSKILAIVSMQNLFGFSVIILFVFFLFYRGDLILKFIKKIRYENIFIIYVILYNLIIPFTSFNSGIDLRQKWMCLIIIFT